ncbi:tetratricopeptide repeat protein [Pleurocapsales cyanobacterium LEGE 10410]|nr:tetratricopeptide repeat protein [Pleurocapsales cyanobacterium LEGE 10410]
MNQEQISENRAKEYLDLGMNKYFGKDYQGAIEDFNQALNLNPDDADAYGNLCVVRYRIGEKRQALEDSKRAAVLYLKQGKIKQHQYALQMQNNLALSV